MIRTLRILAISLALAMQVQFVPINSNQLYYSTFVYLCIVIDVLLTSPLESQRFRASTAFLSGIFLFVILLNISSFSAGGLIASIVIKLLTVCSFSYCVAKYLAKYSFSSGAKDRSLWLDISATSLYILALYGLYQLVCYLTGRHEFISLLHVNQSASLKYGGAIDFRSGFPRFSSLNWEPAYLTPTSTLLFCSYCILRNKHELINYSLRDLFAILAYSFNLALSASNTTLLVLLGWACCFYVRSSRLGQYLLMLPLILYDLTLLLFNIDSIEASGRLDMVRLYLLNSHFKEFVFGRDFSPSISFFSFGGSILSVFGLFTLVLSVIGIYIFQSRISILNLPFFYLALLSLSPWTPWTMWPALPFFFGVLSSNSSSVNPSHRSI
jgi:hypothetical protein